MFKEQPILYYTFPKRKHYILSGLATSLAMFSCALIGLSIGTDHWRETTNPRNNVTKATQGLVQECDKYITKIVCKSVTLSTFLQGMLGVLDVTYSILIGSLIFGLAALLASVVASFHKEHILVTAVVSLEISSALAALFAVSLYTHNLSSNNWSFGWSYGLVWTAIFTMTSASISHFIVQDVKFFGKKICI